MFQPTYFYASITRQECRIVCHVFRQTETKVLIVVHLPDLSYPELRGETLPKTEGPRQGEGRITPGRKDVKSGHVRDSPTPFSCLLLCLKVTCE